MKKKSLPLSIAIAAIAMFASSCSKTQAESTPVETVDTTAILNSQRPDTSIVSVKDIAWENLGEDTFQVRFYADQPKKAVLQITLCRDTATSKKDFTAECENYKELNSKRESMYTIVYHSGVSHLDDSCSEVHMPLKMQDGIVAQEMVFHSSRKRK